jgi:hypothetical protein
MATLYGVNVPNAQVQDAVTLNAVGQYGGVVARYQGPANIGQSPNANYYTAWLYQVDATHAAAYILRNFAGTLSLVGSSGSLGGNFANTLGSQVNVMLQVEGPSIKMFVGGQLEAFGQDTLLTTGSTGIYASQGAVVTGFQDAAATITNVAVPPPTFTETFGSPSQGNQLSNSWTEQAGNFTVASNSATGNAASAVNLAVVNGMSYANQALQTTISFSSVNQAAGLVARYSGAGDTNMYYGMAQNLGGGAIQVYIWKIVNGSWTQLASKKVTSFAGVLSFSVIGSTLTLSTDGTQQLQVTDSSITGPGLAGIKSVNYWGGAATAAYSNFSAS